MFELENILVHENVDLSRPIVEHNKIESSYNNMMYNAISEYKSDFRNITRSFYLELSESANSPEAITEAFSDFFKKVGEIIKKFLKFIQRLFDKFIVHINGLVKSEKYLKKHKDAFSRFTSENEFEFVGYTYTIDSGIPIVDTTSRLRASELKFNYTNTVYDSRESVLSKRIADYKDGIIQYIENDYADIYRGFVIGKSPIASEDYANELFMVYRDDSSEKYSFTVTKSVIDNSYLSFSNYDKLLKNIKSEKERINREYEAVKREIESFSKRFKDSDYKEFITKYVDPNATDVDSVTLSDADKANIALIMKAKADEIILSMDIHSLAFSAKLEAIKERYAQDKTILYKALYKMGIRESGIVDIEDTDENDLFSKDLNEIPSIMDKIKDIRITETGIEIVDDTGNEISIDGDYSMLDIFSPDEKLIGTLKEKGILQVSDGEEDAFSSEIFPIGFRVSNDDLPNPNNISYDIFLASESCEDAKLYAYIQETILKESGQYTNEAYMIIQENLADTIKNAGRKILNAIVTMWNKFVQTMEELFKNDKKYLEKYKNIITEEKVKIESIDCWAYFDQGHGVKLAISNDYNEEIGIGSGVYADEYKKEYDWIKFRNDFLKKIGSQRVLKEEEKGDFQDAILEQLRGSETNYKTEEIQKNMTNMYDFCYNYKNYRDSAKKILEKLDNNVKMCEKEIDRLASQIKEEPTSESAKFNNIFTEENKSAKINVGSPEGDKNDGTSDTNKNAYTTDSKDGDGERTVSNDRIKDIASDSTKTELDFLKKNLNESLNAGSAMLGAKITFGENCYKDYMKIIRAHVRMYAKASELKSPDNKTQAPENTDVKKEKPIEKEKAL